MLFPPILVEGGGGGESELFPTSSPKSKNSIYPFKCVCVGGGGVKIRTFSNFIS